LSFRVYKGPEGAANTGKGVCRNRKSRNFGDIAEVEKMLEQEYLKGSNCKGWKGDK
jgi:hypothetical protein